MNTIERTNLSQLRKCDQLWENMPPTEKGRICQKCSQTIIDFRNRSDKEIAEIHTFTEGQVCGLYRKEQLNFPPKPTVKRKFLRWKSLSIGLVGFLSANSVSGQELKDTAKVVQVEDQEIQKKDTIHETTQPQAIASRDSIVISGRLMDAQNEPIPFGNVHLKNTRIGTTTDFDGYYFLDVSEHLDSTSTFTLVYSYVGYSQMEMVLEKEDLSNEKNRKIDINLGAGEITEFYVLVKPPLHKRIWNGIKRIFTKKE